MKIDSFSPSEYGRPGGWTIRDYTSIDELVNFRDEQLALSPDHKILYILDDKDQADYTSGHSVGKWELSAFPKGYLTSEELRLYNDESFFPAEKLTAIIAKNLLAAAEKDKLDLHNGPLLPINCDDTRLLEHYSDFKKAFIAPLLCYRVRVPEPSLAIAASPNGYFSDDLTPVQNFLLAEHLRTQFGYEIFGLGSYLSIYVRPEPLEHADAHELIESIRGLYNKMTNEIAADWAKLAAGKRWFLMHYRGG